jgi:hypothetical protein
MKKKLKKNPTLTASQMKMRMRMEGATTSLYTDMMNKLLFWRKKCCFLIFLPLGLSVYGANCSHVHIIFIERMVAHQQHSLVHVNKVDRWCILRTWSSNGRCILTNYWSSEWIAGNWSWLYLSSPVKNNNVQFYRRTAIVWKNWKFLAVRQVWVRWPFASVVLHVRFPITWLGNVWELAPPPCSTGLSCLLTPTFWA